MKIIGHRGAAGLAVENTLNSLQTALDLGVDALEFDIRLTKDNQPVLSHDDNLMRVGGWNCSIAQTTYADLRKVRLRNDETIAHFREALTLVGSTEMVVEVKVKDGVKAVLKVLKDFPGANVIIASPVYTEIDVLKHLRPEIPGLIRVVHNPFEALSYARAYKADGLDINFWIMNPLTYYLARHLKFTIMVYTVNHRFFAWFLGKFYPEAWICTNYPNKFLNPKTKK